MQVPHRALRTGDVCVQRYFDLQGWHNRLVVVTEVGEDHVCGMTLDPPGANKQRTPMTWRWTPEQFMMSTTLVTEELHQLQAAAGKM